MVSWIRPAVTIQCLLALWMAYYSVSPLPSLSIRPWGFNLGNYSSTIHENLHSSPRLATLISFVWTTWNWRFRDRRVVRGPCSACLRASPVCQEHFLQSFWVTALTLEDLKVLKCHSKRSPRSIPVGIWHLCERAYVSNVWVCKAF